MRLLSLFLAFAVVSLFITSCEPAPPHITYAKRVGNELRIRVYDGAYGDATYNLARVRLYKGQKIFKYRRTLAENDLAARAAGATLLADEQLENASATLQLDSSQVEPNSKYFVLALDGRGERAYGRRNIEITDVVLHGAVIDEDRANLILALEWLVLPLFFVITGILLTVHLVSVANRSEK